MLSNKALQIRFSDALLVFEFWVADKVPQWLGHLLVTSASPVALIGQRFQETEVTKRCQWKLQSWRVETENPSKSRIFMHQDFGAEVVLFLFQDSLRGSNGESLAMPSELPNRSTVIFRSNSMIQHVFSFATRTRRHEIPPMANILSSSLAVLQG